MSTKRLHTLVLTFLVAAIATGAALAQAPPMAYARIPFDFWIGGSHLPPGEYLIEHLDAASYFYMRSTDGTAGQDVYTQPVDYTPAKDGECRLVFEVRNGIHYLYSGWGPTGQRLVVGEVMRSVYSSGNRAEVPITFR